MFSRRENESSDTETFTENAENTENQTSKGMISRPADVHETDPTDDNRSSKEIYSYNRSSFHGESDNFVEPIDDGDDIHSRDMRNTASRLFSNLNNSKKPQSTQDSSVSTKQPLKPLKAKTLSKPKSFIENLNDTIDNDTFIDPVHSP